MAIHHAWVPPKTRICIWCPLDTLDERYSLTGVIVEQAKALALGGWPVRIWMLSGWKLARDAGAQRLHARYPEIEIRPVLPRLRLYDYTDSTRPPLSYAEADDPVPELEAKTAAIYAEILRQLPQSDTRGTVIFAHDLLFQGWYLPHGLALRRLLAERPHVRALHWQHSCSQEPPDPRPAFPCRSRFAPMGPQGRFVFVNQDPVERQLVARQWEVPVAALAFCPNSRDILEYFEAPMPVCEWVRGRRLLAAELLLFVPARLDGGKQPEKALRYLAALRSCGADARLVWAAPWVDATGEMFRDTKQFAARLGLPAEAVHWTHENEIWRDGCDRATVRAFQQIADLLVLPSLAEGHSLIAMEAALCRQQLVLNSDFPAMRTWFPAGSTAEAAFSSIRAKTEFSFQPGAAHPIDAEQAHLEEQARSLLGALRENPVWSAFSFQKRFRNLDILREQYLLPLITGSSATLGAPHGID